MSNQQNSIMPLPQQFIADIRQIIASARTNAIRSVDFCRVQMYWNLGKRILEEDNKVRLVLIMVHILSAIWQKRSNPNMVAVSEKDNLKERDNFIANIQFRPQCGRN